MAPILAAREHRQFGMYDGAFKPKQHFDGVLVLGTETETLALLLMKIFDGREVCTVKHLRATLEATDLKDRKYRGNERFILNQGNVLMNT